MKTYPILCLVFLTAGLLSCKKKDVLKGFNKAALFAQPTAAEINAVEQTWAQRNLKPANITIEESQQITTKLSAHIISFRLGNIKEYAAVLIPVSDQRLPLLYYIGGFGAEQEPASTIKIKLQEQDLPFIYVVPSMRGQYVRMEVNDKLLRSPLSEGDRFDAFDGATDDVIASLNAVGSLFPQADTSKAMIRGGSRGGSVVLLAGIRDARFKRVAAVAFNADFIAMTAKLYNDPTYKGQFMNGLINGTATIAATRRLMIASSPLYFCRRLPKTQLHSAQNDPITPVTQAEILFKEIKNSGAGDRVELFIYPGRDHNTITTGNAELESRINAFFNELLPAQPAG